MSEPFAGNRHAVTAEQLARGMCCQMWCARHSETLCTDCAVFASEIRAALDAAARTALEAAAEELDNHPRLGWMARDEAVKLVRARAASLGEQTPTGKQPKE